MFHSIPGVIPNGLITAIIMPALYLIDFKSTITISRKNLSRIRVVLVSLMKQLFSLNRRSALNLYVKMGGGGFIKFVSEIEGKRKMKQGGIMRCNYYKIL